MARLHINLHDDALPRWKSAAHRAEMTLSEFVRQAVESRIGLQELGVGINRDGSFTMVPGRPTEVIPPTEQVDRPSNGETEGPGGGR